MSNKYLELKQRHQAELNNFPIFYAFSKEQFETGMNKLGLTTADTNKICHIGGNGYIKKTEYDTLLEMFKRHNAEMNEAIENDPTGEGFIYDMFYYELGNHEYSYTRDIEDTVNALGMTEEQISKNKALLNGLKLACKKQEENDCWN